MPVSAAIIAAAELYNAHSKATSDIIIFLTWPHNHFYRKLYIYSLYNKGLIRLLSADKSKKEELRMAAKGKPARRVLKKRMSDKAHEAKTAGHHHEAGAQHAHATHHPSKPAKKSGIRVLVIYSILLSMVYFFYFLLGLYKPALLFLGGEIRSYAALVSDVIFIAALVYLIYGLVKRKRWAWWFCILWYSLSIVNSIWSVYVMRLNVYNILHELLILSSIFIILINSLIIWYIYAKRHYFISAHHEETFEKRDKIFIYSLVCFWVLLILISFSIGYNFYKETTAMAKGIIEELRDTTPLHAIEICETKEGNERDICFVVFVTLFEKYDLTPVCSRIESDLYRFSCAQAKS